MSDPLSDFRKSYNDSTVSPTISPDLFRSNQWPFHLRVCRDKWEYVNGEWRLELNVSRLTPGAGGVTMPPGKELSSINDDGLRNQWSKQDRGVWRIVSEKHDRDMLAEVLPHGFFMKRVTVNVNGTDRHMFLACWESINELGRIVQDEAEITRIMKHIAWHYFKLTEPTAIAKDAAIKMVQSTLEKVESTVAQRGDKASAQSKKRCLKLRKMLAGMTGDESWMNGFEDVEVQPLPGMKRPKKAKAMKTNDDAAMLAALLKKLGPEKVAELLGGEK